MPNWISPGAAWNEFLLTSTSADSALDSERLGDVNGAAEGREWGAIGLSCFLLSAWWFFLVSVPGSNHQLLLTQWLPSRAVVPDVGSEHPLHQHHLG